MKNLCLKLKIGSKKKSNEKKEEPLNLKLKIGSKKNDKNFNKSIDKQKVKIDNNDNRIEKKISNINEELDAQIDKIRDKLENKEELTTKQNKMVAQVNKLLKTVKKNTKLGDVFKTVSEKGKMILNLLTNYSLKLILVILIIERNMDYLVLMVVIYKSKNIKQ